MINLIWQRPKTCCNWDVLHELFEGCNFNYIYDGDFKVVADNAVIIYSSGNKMKTDAKILEYFNKFNNYVLVHLADESQNHDLSYYARAKRVYRNYYWDNIDTKNVTFIPLGYNNGAGNKDKIKPASLRKNAWIFVGQYKHDRRDMINDIKLMPNFINITHGFNEQKHYTPAYLKTIYGDTVFAPCPMGNFNVECYRLAEALECGCIPVIKKYDNKDYYKNVYGKHPFIIVNEWKELNDLKMDLDKKQSEIYNWYLDFKNNLKIKMLNEIQEALG